MKKQILALTIGALSLCTFAQKDEIKMIEKAVKKNDFITAETKIAALEANENTIDPKLKGKYLFLKGQIYDTIDVVKSSDAYKKLLKFERKTNKIKYTKEAKAKLQSLFVFSRQNASKNYNDGDYKNAKKDFFTAYKLNPKDTTQLYNAAISAQLDKDNKTALKHYEKLNELNYTGIATEYYAVNVVTGKKEYFGNDKKLRNQRVKLGVDKDPTQITLESKQPAIVKNIAYAYVQQGKPELAIKALEKARKANPKDVNLIMNEAQMYVKLNKMDKFGELMEEAIKLNPTDASLFFNLGVVNQNANRLEKAKEYYQKAIDLKPDYRDAILNYGLTVLANEKAIVDEMNKNLSNDKKYDALHAQQKQLYRDAIPYFEKADKLKRNLDSVRILLNMYDTLEMTEKADAIRPIYKQLRNK